MTLGDGTTLESVDIPAGTDPFVSSPDNGKPDERPSFLGKQSGRQREPRATPPPKPEKSFVELKNGVAQFYAFASMVLMPFDQTCATVIANSAEPASEALINLAKENPAVRKFLGTLTQTSAWGAVIAANMPIASVVATHHFAGRRRPEATLFSLHDDEQQYVRHTGATDGSIGKFCPDCRNPVVPGVQHKCPPKGA